MQTSTLDAMGRRGDVQRSFGVRITRATKGLYVDRAMPGARAAAEQLRATGADSRAPRPDAASQGAHPGADPASSSARGLGGLIQTSVGAAAGAGQPAGKRSGWAA